MPLTHSVCGRTGNFFSKHQGTSLCPQIVPPSKLGLCLRPNSDEESVRRGSATARV
jgi:hypothetical protein